MQVVTEYTYGYSKAPLPVEPASRFWAAQRWSLVATLVRRHPELAVVETAAGPDAPAGLTVVSESAWLVTLHADGRMDLPSVGLSGLDSGLAFEHDDPFQLVRLVEDRCSLLAPSGTPAATTRSLAYRVAAALVQATVNEKCRLVVCGVQTEIRERPRQRDGLGRFPEAVKRLKSRPGDPLGQPIYRFWLVLRDDQVVGALDTEGNAYLRDRAIGMPSVYANNGRSVTAVVAASFPALTG